MKGYQTAQGYMGYVPGKGYMLFTSDTEYKEYYAELKTE